MRARMSGWLSSEILTASSSSSSFPLSSSGVGKGRMPEGVGSISRMGTCCVGGRPGMDPVPDGGLVASPGGVIVRGGCVTGGPGMPGPGAGGAPGVVGAAAGGV